MKDNLNEEVKNSEVKDEQKKENLENMNEKKLKRKTKTQELQELKEEYDKVKKNLSELEAKYNDLNDRYLRLIAEFDNYKKRTIKEKSELVKYASETIILRLLEIIDDIERGIEAINKSDNIEALKEGFKIIENKFKEFLKMNGVKEISEKNVEFNVDIHEAISKITVENSEMKGKIIDIIQKGYMLNDKVIRYAKVVVGE